MRGRLSRLDVARDTRPEPGRRQARFPPPIHAGDRAAQDKGEGARREHEPQAHAHIAAFSVPAGSGEIGV